MWKTCVKWAAGRLGWNELFGETQRIPFGVKPGLGVMPSLIVFTFILQVIFGFFIWMGYGASANSAWESIYFLKYEVCGGWLLHGLHFWTAQLLLAEIWAYLLYLILMGKYRAPRELVFWSAVGMSLAVLASHITGDLLTWTQNGYWSTDVRTKFLQMIPWVGGYLYKLAVGGPQMTQMTLARLQAFHVGLFVVGFIGCAVAHWWFCRIAAIREAEMLHREPEKSTGWNIHGLVWLCVAILLVLFVWYQGGTHLGSPRDPSEPFAAARPHWYLAGVYEFAHFFGGDYKIFPIFVIPGCVIGFYLLAPWIARWLIGHFVVVGATAVMLVGITFLTFQLWEKDKINADFQASLAVEKAASERVVELAQVAGIPSDGALELLWNDPQTMGPRLFKQHCVSCHEYTDLDGKGLTTPKPSAPNLHGFASQEWLTGLNDPKQLVSPRYFGGTKYAEDGSMVQFMKTLESQFLTVSDPDSDDYDEELAITAEDVAQNKADFAKFMKLLSDERFAAPGGPIPDETVALAKQFTCTNSCHPFYDTQIAERDAAAGKRVRKTSTVKTQDLTGYGSKAWLKAFIANPDEPRFYNGHNDRMPAYFVDATNPEKNLITEKQLDLLVEWLWTESVGKEVAAQLAANPVKPVETPAAPAEAAAVDTKPAEATSEAAPRQDPKDTLKTNQEKFPPARVTEAAAASTKPASDDFDFDADDSAPTATPPAAAPAPTAPTPEAPATEPVPAPAPTTPVPAAADDFDFDADDSAPTATPPAAAPAPAVPAPEAPVTEPAPAPAAPAPTPTAPAVPAPADGGDFEF
ncbi:MAG: cytochrome b N-terminal domain-containing protein [Thermoguttaceae bacterium]|nr:cytochrome b N-terminal domain-containing protein [Thermoguttaceae bacterium]